MPGTELGDPVAGYFFSVPGGWQAEQEPGRYVVADPSSRIAIMVIPHTASSPREFQPLFDEGWVEPGAELKPDGDAVIGQDRAEQRLAGLVNGEEARAALAIRLGPHGGGVIVLGIVSAAGSDSEMGAAVDAVAGSLRFTTPDTKELLDSWEGLLRGKKLTYLHSYSSSGPAVDGMMTGGGMSEQHEIVLSPDGSFEEAGESSLSIDVGGAEAGGGERTASEGTWRIVPAAGQALLELHRSDGTGTYVLSRSDDEVYLNDRRYFVTEAERG